MKVLNNFKTFEEFKADIIADFISSLPEELQKDIVEYMTNEIK
jgi:hypothetical protein